MKKYGIPLANVYRHFRVMGKHGPSYQVNAEKWAAFKKRLEETDLDTYTGSRPQEWRGAS